MKKTRYIWVSGLVVSTVSIFTSEASASNAYDAGYCREYTRTIHVGGRPQEGYGTACLQPDGSWRITAGDDVGQTISPAYIVEQPVVYIQEPARNVYRTTHYGPRPSYTSFSVTFGDDDGWRDKHYYKKHRRWHDHGRHHGRWDDDDDDYHHRHHHTRRSGNTLSWR